MRLWLEWIPKKQQDIDAGFRDSRSDLLIATERPAAHALDGEPGAVGNQFASRASCDERVSFEFVFVFGGPLEHLAFHVVVGDESDAFGRWALDVYHFGGGHE